MLKWEINIKMSQIGKITGFFRETNVELLYRNMSTTQEAEQKRNLLAIKSWKKHFTHTSKKIVTAYVY